jgi:hypothetical protein
MGSVTDSLRVASKQEELHKDSVWSKEARTKVLGRHHRDLVMLVVVLEVLVQVLP